MKTEMDTIRKRKRCDNENFTCYKCKKTFEKGWTEEEARKEQKEIWGNIPDDQMKTVCDNCFEEIGLKDPQREQIIFNSLSEKDKNYFIMHKSQY